MTRPPRAPLIDHPRYSWGDVLGEGAQGVVVRVIDREQPGLPLVAKLTRESGAGAMGTGSARTKGSAGSDARLEGEFALLARLRIAGLVRVHDYGRDTNGVSFLVEDFIEGRTSRARSSASGSDGPRARNWRPFRSSLERSAGTPRGSSRTSPRASRTAAPRA